jgi:hypothetical protein
MWNTINEIPDCVEPLLFKSDFEHYPYALSGTGFIAAYQDRTFFITAQHCFGNSPDLIRKSAESLIVQLSPSENTNRTSSNRATIKIAYTFGVAQPHAENFPGGMQDIAVMEILPQSNQERDWLVERAVTLRAENLLSIVEHEVRTNFTDVIDRVVVEVRGFPKNGTATSIDNESQKIITQGAIFKACITWEKIYPHTYSLEFLDEHCLVKELDGISGAPVFLMTVNQEPDGKDIYAYAICGMMVNGSYPVGHFVEISAICQAIQGLIDYELAS